MRIILSLILSLSFVTLLAQPIEQKIINAYEAERVEKVLASDAMEGRRAFTPGIEKAAEFIASSFSTAGLQPMTGEEDFLQQFEMLRPKTISVSAELDGKQLDEASVQVFSSEPELKVSEKSGFEIVRIGADDNFFRKGTEYLQAGKNLIVLVDDKHASFFGRLANLKRNMFHSPNHVVFIQTTAAPSRYTITHRQEISRHPLANVVGMIPGKSRKNEYVIFSAHYDHMGIGRPVDGDSIYNGANDDAAGTTAVIMLARYFNLLANNERTLLFVAFTAEEMGGFGSRYFSQQLDPDKVVAMFNIEMIGTESKWGTNSAFITGFDKSDMGEILQRNLEGSEFKFYPDPYPDQQLFYRSDNATLARLGVPAHTISTAKMEDEPHYHKPSDEIETLDMENMAAIIRAIALSSQTIISGKDTPTRVKAEDLR